MSAAPSKKTLTAAERAAKLQEMLAKEEREAAERKQKLTEQIAAQAAKAEAEAAAAAAKASRVASLAAFGAPLGARVGSVTKRLTAEQKLRLMMAQNEGLATNVVDPAAVKKAAEEAFKALAAPQKIEYLRAKAAADIAEAEAKLAVYRSKVEERLARDIAAVHKEAGSPTEALSDLVSAMASSSSMAVSPAAAKSVRRTTQQVYNNLQRELAYEQGRINRRARGEQVSPRPGTRKATPERVKKLHANLAASQMKLNSAATRKLESASKKSASKQKANSNAAALEAYMKARAEKKKAESGAASASSRGNNA